jgi:two-component system nitrate/nitrite response regulator NarL
MSLIDVALIGAGTLHREGLRQSLDPAHFVVVFEGRDFSSSLLMIGNGVSPNLIIADISRPSEKDFESLRRVREAATESRIVILSRDLNLSDIARVFRAGADGYLVSELSPEAFSLLLRAVMTGEKVLPGALVDLLASNHQDFLSGKVENEQGNLTDRERQILRCLLNGYSNKLIARVLDITEGTVKVHLKTLMKKISAVNRTQAALWARSQGIGEDPDPLNSKKAATAPNGKPLLALAPSSEVVGGHTRIRNGHHDLGNGANGRQA